MVRRRVRTPSAGCTVCAGGWRRSGCRLGHRDRGKNPGWF